MAMAIADSLLQYALKLRILLARGHVIYDRYLDDGALDLQLRFPEAWLTWRHAWSILDALSPRPDVALLLMLPQEVMEHRLALKDEPFPDPPAIREARYAAYQAIAASGTYTVIDANQSIDDVHADIRTHIERVRP